MSTGSALMRRPARFADVLALTAIEWGWRAAEKGWNLDKTIHEYAKVLSAR